MKYLKLIPFALFGIYFILIKSIPNMEIEIKILTALIIFIISTYLLFKLKNNGNLKKRNLLIFIFFIISIFIATFFYFKI